MSLFRWRHLKKHQMEAPLFDAREQQVHHRFQSMKEAQWINRKLKVVLLPYSSFVTSECCCCCNGIGINVTFQSSDGSFTNTSMVLSKRSGWALYARREWTMMLWIKPDSFNGCIRFTNCWVSRKGMSSGTGRNCWHKMVRRKWFQKGYAPKNHTAWGMLPVSSALGTKLMANLCGRAECMTEVNTNHASCFHVDHKVGKMAVPDT